MKDPLPLIFDCDGVIVDSEIVATRVVLRGLRELGYQGSEADYTRNYSGLLENEIRARLAAEHGLEISEAGFQDILAQIHATMQVELKPIAGMPELIRGLDLPLAVASNSRVSHVESSLALAGVSHWVGPRIFSAEQVPRAKPHPDLYLHALRSLGYAAAETWVVEDSEAGVTAAKAAGTTVVGFLGASHIHPGHDEKLLAAGADHLATDAQELQRVLYAGLLRQV